MRTQYCWDKALLFLVVALLLAPAVASCSQEELDDAARKDKVFAMYDEYSEDFPGVRDISPEDALALDESERVFVDVRPEEERAVSIIPGAISANEFLADPASYSSQTVIAYCTISYRSGEFAEELDGQGVEVVNLRGGLLGWTHAGGPLVDDQGRATTTLHVFGSRWDLAPLSHETVW